MLRSNVWLSWYTHLNISLLTLIFIPLDSQLQYECVSTSKWIVVKKYICGEKKSVEHMWLHKQRNCQDVKVIVFLVDFL